MLSVGAIRFEGKFCASKKGGIGGGEFQHRVAALAGLAVELMRAWVWLRS